MAHKDYVGLWNQLNRERPKIDLNGDGVVDPIIQGHISQASCDKIPGCTIVDGYACAPTLKNGYDAPVPFSKAPTSFSRLFGQAEVFVFNQTSLTTDTLRFFPDDASGGLFESPTSFAVGQVAGYFDPAGKLVSFPIEGFAVGLQKQETPTDIQMVPSRDQAGQVRRIAYGKGADGKTIEKPVAELIWVSPDGQAIDPQVLVAGDSKDRPVTAAEKKLLPLFKKAQALALKFKKLQQKETGPRDLRGVSLTSLKIRRQARDEMEAMLRAEFPHSLFPNPGLADGVRIALGKVVGLNRADLTVPSIQNTK